MKAYMRRAQAQEAMEKYEEALEGVFYWEMFKYNFPCAVSDYKKVIEMDPSQMAARRALVVGDVTLYNIQTMCVWKLQYLPEKIAEQREKLKTEMLGTYE